MSVTGLTGVSQVLETYQNQGSHHQANQSAESSQLQRLGQDLQSGDLTQARQALASLSSTLPYQEFTSLQEALQSGNVAAALSAYSALQEALSQTGVSAASSGATLNTTA